LNTEDLEILRCLAGVRAERKLRAADAALANRVVEIKRFQHSRFESTYADLLAQKRYAPATSFFLEDLYGPGDFTQRDEQFARVVPALVRLFPHQIVQTVAKLARLHELSENLDTQMGQCLEEGVLSTFSYGCAWRAVGRSKDRDQQIALMLEVGHALDQFTKNLVLRGTLRMMRGPASAAGLGALQAFLESGFDAFREMHGAEQFLETIFSREKELAQKLFARPTELSI
jgi:hypothetical protein